MSKNCWRCGVSSDTIPEPSEGSLGGGTQQRSIRKPDGAKLVVELCPIHKLEWDTIIWNQAKAFGIIKEGQA